VSLTALTERVHSDGAIPPGRKCFLLMEANAIASDVSEANTVLQSVTISKLNINESAACGDRPKKGIHIARRCVNCYSITAAPAKSVTHMSF